MLLSAKMPCPTVCYYNIYPGRPSVRTILQYHNHLPLHTLNFNLYHYCVVQDSKNNE
jgi:hypothetical protein